MVHLAVVDFHIGFQTDGPSPSVPMFVTWFIHEKVMRGKRAIDVLSLSAVHTANSATIEDEGSTRTARSNLR